MGSIDISKSFVILLDRTLTRNGLWTDYGPGVGNAAMMPPPSRPNSGGDGGERALLYVIEGLIRLIRLIRFLVVNKLFCIFLSFNH